MSHIIEDINPPKIFVFNETLFLYPEREKTMRRSNTIESYRPSKKRFPLSIRNPMVKRRRCLMCGKKFISKGPHNRRCKRCNIKIAQAGENAFYLPRVYSTTYHYDESISRSD